MISIKVEDRVVRSMLDVLEERIRDLSEPMNAIGVYIVKRSRERFEQSGPGWPPLSPLTIRKKGSDKPLIDRGILMQSIGFGTKGIFEVDYNSVRVGTNLEYAAVHQFGTNRAGRNHSVHIPARPFLVVEDEDVRVMQEIIRQYILRGGE